jgi:glucose/arabinose dehydrogenase
VLLRPRRHLRFLTALLGGAVIAALALAAWHPNRSGAVAVSFQPGTLNGSFAHPTSLAFGPDGRLYVASGTTVRALTLNAEGTRVTAVELIAFALENALGIAFDPTAPASPVTVYVSRQEPTATAGFRGTISKLTAPDWQMADVITGLPTSDPYLNHMTNGIAFDNQGRLFIAQGSGSNAGLAVPNGVQTYWPETPLSGAILVADIHAAGFDGAITYNPPGPPADYSVDQTGGDVRVFAAGLRNPYDVVLHSNGHIYATDNGPMGDVTSLTCALDGGSVSQSDELNLIAEGNYYGFPNRNRGRSDPRQCTYHAPEEGSGAGFTAPIAILPAHCSCDGIAEYTSDAFGGAMRGDLIIAQFGSASIGRVVLSGGGTGATVSTLASGLDSPLDVAVAPTGMIYIADYGRDRITYLQPQTGTATPGVTETPSATPAATEPGPTATTTTQPPATSTPPPTATPTAVAAIVGDANCDDAVNAIDAALVLQLSAGLITELPCSGGDVNGDGRVNAIDATLILQYVAGLIPTLPPPR